MSRPIALQTVRPGEIMSTRSTIVDLTDRVPANETPHLQDQRLAATYDSADIGIAEVNADGRLARVNAHLSALLGYSARELLGCSIFDPDLNEDLKEDLAQFRRLVTGEIDRYTIEKRVQRRDGGELWMSITSASVRDAEGRFLYAVRVQQDIGARKSVEEALARRAEEQAALFEFIDRLQYRDFGRGTP